MDAQLGVDHSSSKRNDLVCILKYDVSYICKLLPIYTLTTHIIQWKDINGMTDMYTPNSAYMRKEDVYNSSVLAMPLPSCSIASRSELDDEIKYENLPLSPNCLKTALNSFLARTSIHTR